VGVQSLLEPGFVQDERRYSRLRVDNREPALPPHHPSSDAAPSEVAR
jgi:hypothetical protein